MIYSPRFIAVLDACVLYPAPIRDLLLHLADANLYTPKWTERIHEEWTRNLLINRPDLNAGQLRKTVDAMNGAFPDATVIDYETLIDSVHLPDPNDCHILAAALRIRAGIIVTANLKDFPNGYLSQYDIEAQHPDQFIVNLTELNPEEVLGAFRAQVSNLKRPPKTALQVLKTFRLGGLEMTAKRLSDML